MSMVSPGESAEFEELVERLEQADLFGRITATRELVRFGSRAVGPLCGALRSSEASVRRSAAQALGRIGDPAAVRPLLDALNTSFERGTPRNQRWIGLTLFAGAFALPLVVLSWFYQAPYPTSMNAELVAFLVSGACLSAYLYRRSGRGLLQLTIGEALSSIAAANPDPSIRQSVSQLRAMSRDRLYVREEQREGAARLATEIEKRLARTRALPIAANAQRCESGDLPLPARVATPAQETLPRTVIQ